ncbi:MAG TPA: chemotaxis protein CheC [Gaiellaceae bacterium]|nr:chemotaxis protein CheC [Gaiellaceae bacterium]
MKTMYSDQQLDALRELANIGSGTAATALSKLVGRTIDVSVPTALALPLADAIDAVGAPEETVTAVVMPISGDLGAIVLLLFPPADAEVLCRLLGVEADSEVGRSALGEIGNILGSAYVGALGVMTGLALEPSPPESTTDMLGAIVATVLANGAEETDVAFVLDSNLDVEGAECSLSFMLVPSRAGVGAVLAGLGLAG